MFTSPLFCGSAALTVKQGLPQPTAPIFRNLKVQRLDNDGDSDPLCSSDASTSPGEPHNPPAERAATLEPSPDNLDPLAGQDVMTRHASAQGLLCVFGDEYMSREVVGMVGTTSTPLWGHGPVPILVSLRVSEHAVQGLAMSLFGAVVERTGQALRITLQDGSVTQANPDYDLRGVSMEAVIKVFSSVIHGAIKSKPVFLGGPLQGKPLTDLFSMKLMDNGAIVNLYLNSESNDHIFHQLYM